MTTFYNTEQQTIHSITELLTAHGYDPTHYDLPAIAADYQHTPGLYDSVFNDPSLVWAHVAQHQRNTTKTRDDLHRDVADLLKIRSALPPYRDPAAYDVGAIVTDFHNTYGHYNIGSAWIGSHDVFELINNHYQG